MLVTSTTKQKKSKGLRKADKELIQDLTAIDKGGPTRELLNRVSCQIEDLVVYLPICKDKTLKVLDEKDGYVTKVSAAEFMEPKCGWKVEEHHGGKSGRVLNYNSSTKIATVKFPGIEIDMHREDFKITGIPIRLFEEDTCLPCRDHVFQVDRAKNDDESKTYTLQKFTEELRKRGIKGKEMFERMKQFQAAQSNKQLSQFIVEHEQAHETSRIDDQLWRMISKYDKNLVRADLEMKVQQMMRSYYRAFGRLVAHVIFDSDNALSSKVLPKLLRNGKYRSGVYLLYVF
jgi:hypothetical protein